jgi:hypothetical protein
MMSTFSSCPRGICNTAALARGDLSIAQRGDSHEFECGLPRGRAATVCIVCTKVLPSPETAKWVSPIIPQTALRRLFRLSAPCVRTTRALRKIAREIKVPWARRRGVAPSKQLAIPTFDGTLRASNRGAPEGRNGVTGPPCQTHRVTLKCEKLTYQENIGDFSASNGDSDGPFLSPRCPLHS